MSLFQKSKNVFQKNKDKDKRDDDDKDKKDKGKSKGVEGKKKEPKETVLEQLDAIIIKSCQHDGQGMMGMFAKRGIHLGTRVIKEVPLLSSNEGVNHKEIYESYLALPEFNRARIRELSFRDDRKKYHYSKINAPYAMQNLCKGSKALEDEAAQVLAIFDNNQIPLQHSESTAKHLALKIARINHSCSPNVAISWNESRNCFVVHTLRFISEGDEITCSYIFLPEPREVRQEALQAFGINCKCYACNFTLLSSFEQGQKLVAKDREQKPGLKRRTTGELNQYMLNYVMPMSLRMDNRRRFFRRNLTMVNDETVQFKAAVYEEMIDFLSLETPGLAEEVAKLNQSLAMLCAGHGPQSERDWKKSAKACGAAIALMKICYGIDGDRTMKLTRYLKQSSEEYQGMAKAEIKRITERSGNVAENVA